LVRNVEKKAFSFEVADWGRIAQEKSSTDCAENAERDEIKR
jgi:hypothetical protein